METSASRIPAAPPPVLPVAAGTVRPQWSVMIPAYNCAAYLEQTLRSVLAQDLGPAQMQVVVVDDHSTDADLAALVARVGQGRVGYYRQPRNVGSLRNFETCLNLATGHWVHLLHGDDRVAPGFYDQVDALAQQYPEAGAIFGNYASINEAGECIFVPEPLPDRGILQDWLLRLAECQYIQYAAIAVRREVYEQLGGFYGTNYGEDWEMWVRIARYYPMVYTPKILAEYRGHAASISSQKEQMGLALPDLAKVMRAIEQHLPASERARISLASRKGHAAAELILTYRLFKETRNWSQVRHRIRQAMALSRAPHTYYHLLRLYLKLFLHRYAGYERTRARRGPSQPPSFR